MYIMSNCTFYKMYNNNCTFCKTYKMINNLTLCTVFIVRFRNCTVHFVKCILKSYSLHYVWL